MSKAIVTVSPKFQIVIPKELRQELHIEPGQQLLLYTLDGSIRISPRRSIKDLRGIAEGICWRIATTPNAFELYLVGSSGWIQVPGNGTKAW